MPPLFARAYKRPGRPDYPRKRPDRTATGALAEMGVTPALSSGDPKSMPSPWHAAIHSVDHHGTSGPPNRYATPTSAVWV